MPLDDDYDDGRTDNEVTPFCELLRRAPRLVQLEFYSAGCSGAGWKRIFSTVREHPSRMMLVIEDSADDLQLQLVVDTDNGDVEGEVSDGRLSAKVRRQLRTFLHGSGEWTADLQHCIVEGGYDYALDDERLLRRRRV